MSSPATSSIKGLECCRWAAPPDICEVGAVLGQWVGSRGRLGAAVCDPGLLQNASRPTLGFVDKASAVPKLYTKNQT